MIVGDCYSAHNRTPQLDAGGIEASAALANHGPPLGAQREGEGSARWESNASAPGIVLAIHKVWATVRAVPGGRPGFYLTRSPSPDRAVGVAG